MTPEKGDFASVSPTHFNGTESPKNASILKSFGAMAHTLPRLPQACGVLAAGLDTPAAGDNSSQQLRPSKTPFLREFLRRREKTQALKLRHMNERRGQQDKRQTSQTSAKGLANPADILNALSASPLGTNTCSSSQDYANAVGNFLRSDRQPTPRQTKPPGFTGASTVSPVVVVAEQLPIVISDTLCTRNCLECHEEITTCNDPQAQANASEESVVSTLASNQGRSA